MHVYIGLLGLTPLRVCHHDRQQCAAIVSRWNPDATRRRQLNHDRVDGRSSQTKTITTALYTYTDETTCSAAADIFYHNNNNNNIHFNRAKTNRSTNTMPYRHICLAGQLYI